MPALLLVALLATSAPAELIEQRDAYLKAENLIESRRFTDYRSLRPDLDEYPLAIYLDYQLLDARLSRVPGDEANAFLDAAEGTPLALRFKDRYLRSQGGLRRWANVLEVSPERPVSVDLQCYFYRAQNQVGDRDMAWDGARELWVYGKSRPKACDPLFNEWLKAGQMTDDISWQRQLLAFDARRRGLISYSAGKGSEALEPWSEKLLAAYRRPDRVQKLDLPIEDPRSRDIYVKALKRLARRDAGKAVAIWQRESTRYPFTEQQAEEAQDGIAWRALFQDSADTDPWLDNYLAARGDGRMLEKRLRNAIAASDWPAIEALVAHLPEDYGQKPVWRFWEAYAARENGHTEKAQAIWEALADEREYYGFLAAELAGKPYQLNHDPLPPLANPEDLEGLDGVRRTEELMHHQRGTWAKSEWRYLLPSLTETQQVQLAQYANGKGWYRFAIDAAVAAGVWDALELRFPRAFEPTFVEIGQQYSIPETELMAIARRESAFYPEAESGAGARGLMQLLPSTARSVAPYRSRRDLSQRLFDVETNVALGGAYYRQLLDNYGNNRVLTLAAYNAGPHRVRRWTNRKNPTMTAPQWVESLPFEETRDYVKGVLSYNVVYRSLGNAPASLFNRDELERRY